MEKIKEKRKEDFKKRLYKLSLETIEFMDKLGNDNVSKKIGDQLLRSIMSIIGNYTEAKSSGSKKEYIYYFNNSLRSANESILWFSMLKDSGRAGHNSVDRFLRELDEIARIFASSILTMKNLNQKSKSKQ